MAEIRRSKKGGAVYLLRCFVRWVWRVLVVLGVVNLVINFAREDINRWITTLLRDGQLIVEWGGAAPPGAVVHASREYAQGGGNTAVPSFKFDLGRRVSLPAGDYALKVVQYERELPVLFADKAAPTSEGSLAKVKRWRTTELVARFGDRAAPLSDVYRGQLAALLGRPTSKARVTERVYEGFFEKGKIIYSLDRGTFLVVSPSDAFWTEELDAPHSEDPCVYKQDCVDRLEKAPANRGLHAPIAGALPVWRRHREKLDWSTGFCIYHNQVNWQDFEHGILIWPLKASRAGVLSQALALTKTEKGRSWFAPNLAGVAAPDCRQE